MLLPPAWLSKGPGAAWYLPAPSRGTGAALAKNLNSRGLCCGYDHGDRSQSQRTRR